jgi:hypothetical protein
VVVSGATATLNASQADLITFTFSEAVNGFDLADISVSGGTLGAITQSDATHYTATFTPTVGATAATIQVLASGTGTSSWTDLADNAGTASRSARTPWPRRPPQSPAEAASNSMRHPANP